MHDYISEMLGNLRTSHEGSFMKWEQSLLQELIKNIVNLNPELRKLQEQIDAQAQQISNLRNRKERLQVACRQDYRFPRQQIPAQLHRSKRTFRHHCRAIRLEKHCKAI